MNGIRMPLKYKRLIAKTMREEGPRALIESMVQGMAHGMVKNNHNDEAILRMHATLVEILKHWPEDNHRFTPADHER
jgi:hypothetical protein